MEQVRALGRIQATYDEAASILRVSRRLFYRFLSDYPDAKEAFDDGKLEGLVSLRRKQFLMAEKNPTMAIWLGKQYLGQVDRRELEVGNPGDFDRMSRDELREYIRTEAEALGLSHLAPQGSGRSGKARSQLN